MVETDLFSRSKTQMEDQSSDETFLDVPAYMSRRSSLDSAFAGTDISELSTSYRRGSGIDEPLFRTLSGASSTGFYVDLHKSRRSRTHDFFEANYGVLLVLLSQFFGSMMNISTRLLETPGSHGEPMHPFQILFVRQSITALLCTGYALWSKSIPHFPLGPPGKVRLLLVARGLTGFFGVFGMYFSLRYLPVSEATVLTFLAPILTCYACSVLIPGETFTKQQQIAGFVSLLGVVLIAQPFSFIHSSSTAMSATFTETHNLTSTADSDGFVSSDHPQASRIPSPTPSQHLSAVGIAMVGVVGATGAMTSIRAIGARAHAFISVNYFSVWCSFVSLVALVVFPDVEFRLPSNLQEWGLLSILGFAGFVLQSLLTMGLAYGGPTASSTESQKPAAEEEEEDIEMNARQVDPQISGSLAPAATVAGDALGRSRGRSQRPRPRNQYASSGKPQNRSSVSGTRATSMVYCQMLFALAGDKLIFGVTPTFWSWIGSGLVLVGAIWVAAARSPVSSSEGAKFDGVGTAMASKTDVVGGQAGKSSHTETEELAGQEEVGLLEAVEPGDEMSDEETQDTMPELVQGGRSWTPRLDDT